MGKYLGAVLTVLIIGAGVAGVVAGVGIAAHELPLMKAQASGSQANGYKSVTLHIQTFPNSPYENPDWIQKHVTGQKDFGFDFPPSGDNQDWVTYWPTTTLQVPTHAIVTVVLDNYDGATPLLNPFYATPRGVTDDQGTATNSISVDGKPVTSVDPGNVSHTFTIHSIVDGAQPWLFVTVPVTAVADDAKLDAGGFPFQPVQTVFSFVTPDKPGHYIWQCFDPCGSGFNGFGGPMSTKGYMSGTLDVVG
ncbi:MAG TPA: hypothetical protein VIC85_19375 [Ktedonobacterales bacterium]|jgi:hypothetical protein